MDRLDLSPPSQPASPAGAGADDVAPLSLVRPGKVSSARTQKPDRPIATSFARVRTGRAYDYLDGLNLHWHRHVHVVAHSEAHAEIVFPLGCCALDASDDSLDVSLRASSNYDAALLEDLISETIDRLALSEDLQYQWIRPAPSAARDAQAGRNCPRHIFSFRRAEGAMPHNGSRP